MIHRTARFGPTAGLAALLAGTALLAGCADPPAPMTRTTTTEQTTTTVPPPPVSSTTTTTTHLTRTP